MEFKSDWVRYLIFRNKSQYNKSATLCRLEWRVSQVEIRHRKGIWKFCGGEAGPG
jgi:hypothetical protein